MNKKTIRLFFCDFWNTFDISNNFIVNNISDQYNVIIDNKEPEYVFYSGQGNTHLTYNNAVKIYYTGENLVPDFNQCDYAIGFHHISFEDRYFRLPLYVRMKGFIDLYKDKSIEESLANRKFCNFIYSNSSSADPFRNLFFNELCKYKKVDSGGKAFNNINKYVDDKIQFISQYKFTIAFENSSVSGYTTEKLMEPMLVKSLPIYWGNPNVNQDFNIKSFIEIKNKSDIDQAINNIIKLDTNDELYLERLSHPWLVTDTYKQWEHSLTMFFNSIFNQPLENAKRKALYGANKELQEKTILNYNKLHQPNNPFKKLFKKII